MTPSLCCPIIGIHDLQASELLDAIRPSLKIASTNGCFDLLHAGHIRTLTFARQQGDFLVVGLNTDRSVSQLKGPGRPLQDERSRSSILASLRMVDLVILMDDVSEFIRLVRPLVHVKGWDYYGKPMPETPIVAALGGEVCFAPFEKGQSTSSLWNRFTESRR